MIFEYLKRLGSLKNSEDQTSTIDNLKFKYLGLYFTAQWCRSCHMLAPHLKNLYEEVNKNDHLLQMVTLRLDNENTDFGHYYWRFSNSSEQENGQLASILQVRHLPSILIFNVEGRLISRTGYNDMKKFGEQTFEYWNSL